MKRVFVLVLFLLTASVVYSQTPTVNPQSKAAITDKAHAEIRDLQLAVANTIQQAQAAIAPYNNRIQQLNGQIQELLDKAFKETGADPEKYQLDPNTLALVEKLKAPNPQVKQPAKEPTKEPTKKP